MRFLFWGGIFAVFLALCLSWLLTNDASPLNEYLLWHPQIRNFWAIFELPSYLAGSIATGNPHNVNNFAAWTIFILQWFLTGVFLTMTARALFGRRKV